MAFYIDNFHLSKIAENFFDFLQTIFIVVKLLFIRQAEVQNSVKDP